MSDGLDDETRALISARRRKSNTPLVLALAGGGALLTCCGLSVVGVVFLKDRVAIGGTVVRWGEAAKVGPLEVRLESAGSGGFGGKSRSGQMFTNSGRSFVVRPVITNTDPKASRTVRPVADVARLRDTRGNTYTRQYLTNEFREPIPIMLQIDREQAVPPSGTLRDLLAFEEPPESADLLLTLDAAAYGGSGSITFEIPSEDKRRGR